MFNMYDLPDDVHLKTQVEAADYANGVNLSFGIYKDNKPTIRDFILLQRDDARTLLDNLAKHFGLALT